MFVYLQSIGPLTFVDVLSNQKKCIRTRKAFCILPPIYIYLFTQLCKQVYICYGRRLNVNCAWAVGVRWGDNLHWPTLALFLFLLRACGNFSSSHRIKPDYFQYQHGMWKSVSIRLSAHVSSTCQYCKRWKLWHVSGLACKTTLVNQTL